MRNLLKGIVLLLAPSIALAAGGGAPLKHVDIDLSDKASLQRGAQIFINYCLSCHSAAFMRYNRMAKDLGLSEEQVKENLMFASDKVGDLMTVAMRPDDAARWFGTTPPDLSVIARSRTPDWLYTYMLSFYRDDNPSRPFGVNNLVFRDVAMPHVLSDLQGIQVPVYAEHKGSDGRVTKVVEGLELEEEGLLTAGQYKKAMRDLVNFLVYLGEPAKLERYRLGTLVLLFLAVFFVLAYALKKEYWKDVH